MSCIRIYDEICRTMCVEIYMAASQNVKPRSIP